MKLFLLLVPLIGIAFAAVLLPWRETQQSRQSSSPPPVVVVDEGNTSEPPHPLSIQALRETTIQPSTLTIEETLAPGSNYRRYRAAYYSEGFKQYGLLTIPNGLKPEAGWPAIIFNHGYIPPAQYRTTERYIAYTDGFSRNGYVVFRPDYRGHDRSEGIAVGGYGSNAYTIDVLHALVSLQQHPDVDPKNIGMWGHSMGGHITLRSMVVNPDIKAGVIWAGVVASYPDLLNNWRRGTNTATPQPLPSGARRWRQVLIDEFGTPEQNPKFWSSISSTSFLKDISGPVQIHHGTADASVPYQFSVTLDELLKKEQKPSELYIYQGDDHDITNNFGTAMSRSIAFFDRYLKNK